MCNHRENVIPFCVSWSGIFLYNVEEALPAGHFVGSGLFWSYNCPYMCKTQIRTQTLVILDEY